MSDNTENNKIDTFRLRLQFMQERVHEQAKRFRPEIERIANGGYDDSELDRGLIRFIASALLGDLALEDGDIAEEGNTEEGKND